MVKQIYYSFKKKLDEKEMENESLKLEIATLTEAMDVKDVKIGLMQEEATKAEEEINAMKLRHGKIGYYSPVDESGGDCEECDE